MRGVKGILTVGPALFGGGPPPIALRGLKPAPREAWSFAIALPGLAFEARPGLTTGAGISSSAGTEAVAFFGAKISPSSLSSRREDLGGAKGDGEGCTVDSVFLEKKVSSSSLSSSQLFAFEGPLFVAEGELLGLGAKISSSLCGAGAARALGLLFALGENISSSSSFSSLVGVGVGVTTVALGGLGVSSSSSPQESSSSPPSFLGGRGSTLMPP